jgi:malonyl-CoA O-methyltransferase
MKSIAAHFGAAAQTYEDAASVQARVATALAERIAALPLPPRPRILEIGCGTGLLGRALADQMPSAAFHFTDIAAPMAAACRRNLGGQVVVMDGERPCFGPTARFDLVCTSLSVQWFRDPATALPRLAGLLAPGGYLAFATMAEDSFREWHAATLIETGRSAGIPSYPKTEAWRGFLPRTGTSAMTEERILRPYENGLAFLTALKRIGADRPVEGYRPLPPGALRRVLRRFERGIVVTYHIAYGIYGRPGSA